MTERFANWRWRRKIEASVAVAAVAFLVLVTTGVEAAEAGGEVQDEAAGVASWESAELEAKVAEAASGEESKEQKTFYYDEGKTLT